MKLKEELASAEKKLYKGDVLRIHSNNIVIDNQKIKPLKFSRTFEQNNRREFSDALYELVRDTKDHFYDQHRANEESRPEKRRGYLSVVQYPLHVENLLDGGYEISLNMAIIPLEGAVDKVKATAAREGWEPEWLQGGE